MITGLNHVTLAASIRDPVVDDLELMASGLCFFLFLCQQLLHSSFGKPVDNVVRVISMGRNDYWKHHSFRVLGNLAIVSCRRHCIS